MAWGTDIRAAPELSPELARALTDLKVADTAPAVESLAPDELNTEFRYHLRDGETVTPYYLEVKTRTPTSRVRSLLPLPDAQMRQAAAYGEALILLVGIYDEARDQIVGFHSFRDVIRLMATGMLPVSIPETC